MKMKMKEKTARRLIRRHLNRLSYERHGKWSSVMRRLNAACDVIFSKTALENPANKHVYRMFANRIAR